MERKTAILITLSSTEKPITSSELASVIDVSSRTVREEIKLLNEDLKAHGASIQSQIGKGYQLAVQNADAFKQYIQSLRSAEEPAVNLPTNPNERQFYLLDLFLHSHHSFKLDDLSEQLHVSRSTLQTDLKAVREKLRAYSLEIISRPNYGIHLEGSELNRRFAISEYLFNHNEVGPNLVQLQQVSTMTGISENMLNKIWIILLEQIARNQIVLSDISLNNLFMHIVIAFRRIQDGYNINMFERDISDIKEQPEFFVAQKIVHQIESLLQIDFPKAEIAYIAIHLLGTKLVDPSQSHMNNVQTVVDPEIQTLIQRILRTLKEELSIDLLQDQELITSLGLHLKPAINRFRYQMNIRNPLLEDIKVNYPLAFEAGIIAAIVINQVLSVDIDENEVGYIALHIGAAIERNKEHQISKRCYIVCASGVGSSKLIQYKLQSEFKTELDILGTTELYRIHEIPYDQIDFLISAVPITDTLPVPVIEVNTIMSRYDLLRIEQYIKTEQKEWKSFIDAEHTFLNRDLSSKEEVFHFLVEKLSPLHRLSDHYISLLEEREAIAPTAYGNLVAVPHPITPHTEQTFLTFCTLAQPIEWGDKKVQFVCLLNVEKDSQEDLQLLYEVLGKIVNTPAVVQKLIQCTSYSSFNNVIQSLIS